MSGPVDVLAVMDAASAGCSMPGCPACIVIAKSRAAVAVLIDEATSCVNGTGDLADLRRALAACGAAQ